MKKFSVSYLIYFIVVVCDSIFCNSGVNQWKVSEIILEFPQQGLDDYSTYKGYSTRFFHDINKNTVQVYIKQDVGRVVNVLANGFNESIGFSASKKDGTPALISWNSNRALIFGNGGNNYFKYSLTSNTNSIILGHFYLGTMRQERDIQHFKKHLEPFSTNRFIDDQFNTLIKNIDQLPIKYQNDHLLVLNAPNIERLIDRLNPIVTIQEKGKQNIILVSKTSFDGKNNLLIEFSFSDEIDTYIQGNNIVLSSINNKPISFDVTISSDAPQLHPIGKDQLFNEDFIAFHQKIINRGNNTISQKLTRQLKSLELLSSKEKLMASSPNYATYFGRDMMMSALMMESILNPEIIEFVINSVLKKTTKNGEVSHEEGLGGQAIRENVNKYNKLMDSYFVEYINDKRILNKAKDILVQLNKTTENYLMIDDDFQLSVLVGQYLSLSTVSSNQKKNFLLGFIDDNRTTKRIDVIVSNMIYVDKLTRDYVVDPSFKNLISFKKRKDGRWHSGSWRDSGAGYGNGRYGMDINAIWAPKALESFEIIFSTLKSLNILIEPSIIKNSELGSSGLKNYYLNPNQLHNAIIIWQNVISRYQVSIDNQTALSDIRGKTEKMLIEESTVWWEILENKLIPNAITFYAIALDEKGKPVPVMHTDISTLFFLNNFTEEIIQGEKTSNEVLNFLIHFTEPYPMGLFIQGVGPVVSNDMFASMKVWENFQEDQYHSPKTIWGREVNLLIIGLTKQILTAYDETGKLRDDKLKKYLEELNKILNKIIDSVDQSGLKDSELWSYKVQKDIIIPIRYGISSDIQLWNLTNMAAQYLLFQLPNNELDSYEK